MSKLSIPQFSTTSSELVFDEAEKRLVIEPTHQSSSDLGDEGTGAFRVPAAGNPDEMGYDRHDERTFKRRRSDSALNGHNRHGLWGDGFHSEPVDVNDLPDEPDNEELFTTICEAGETDYY